MRTTGLMTLAGLMLAIIVIAAPHVSIADEADPQPAFDLKVATR
jgi:hypothetical protein